jgi:hypothetical protein
MREEIKLHNSENPGLKRSSVRCGHPSFHLVMQELAFCVYARRARRASVHLRMVRVAREYRDVPRVGERR